MPFVNVLQTSFLKNICFLSIALMHHVKAWEHCVTETTSQLTMSLIQKVKTQQKRFFQGKTVVFHCTSNEICFCIQWKTWLFQHWWICSCPIYFKNVQINKLTSVCVVSLVLKRIQYLIHTTQHIEWNILVHMY